MDERDLRIANLEGQVKAHQDQSGSMAIDLLRVQFERMKQRLDKLERSCSAEAAKNGMAIGTLEDRLAKARNLFTEIRSELSELRKAEAK